MFFLKKYRFFYSGSGQSCKEMKVSAYEIYWMPTTHSVWWVNSVTRRQPQAHRCKKRFFTFFIIVI